MMRVLHVVEAMIVRDGLGTRVRLLGARHDAGDLLEACELSVLSSVREGLSVRLLADPEVPARMGRAAHERGRAEFTAERMVRETENLYRSVLGRRGMEIERSSSRGNAA